MNKFYVLLFVFSINTCLAQTEYHSNIEFTKDLETFQNLAFLKETLKDVDLIALGENTHGLGAVFNAKTELVKFLHEELGFNLILFESGFGDAALAWEQINSRSAKSYTRIFTSNFYYHTEEIQHLVEYVKSQNNNLVIQGFDCQPQQDFLVQRMTEIMQPKDSLFANTVSIRMKNFNKLYQFEYDKDTVNFYTERDRFLSFLLEYQNKLEYNQETFIDSGTTIEEINAILQSIKTFKSTYANLEIGNLMGWPISNNIRDAALYETVNWYKVKNPEAKIIIWAQNSHIENRSKPGDDVHWMGHLLKVTYGEKYYSMGSVVYSGKNLNYNDTFEFEHQDKNFLAYHLNQYNKDKFIVDLRNYKKDDYISTTLLGMENNGNTARFIAKERFDGLLFIRYSDIPTLIDQE